MIEPVKESTSDLAFSISELIFLVTSTSNWSFVSEISFLISLDAFFTLLIPLARPLARSSLSFKLKTKTFDDYGNLFLKIIGKNSAKIIQLVNSDNKIKYEKITDFENELSFENIEAGKYYVRIIFDKNNNGKYDTGNFLNRIMPERVTYFPEIIDIRAGWDFVQEFIVNE